MRAQRALARVIFDPDSESDGGLYQSHEHPPVVTSSGRRSVPAADRAEAFDVGAMCLPREACSVHTRSTALRGTAMAMRKHMPRILRKADNPKGIGIDSAETDLFPDAFIGEMVKDGDGTRAPYGRLEGRDRKSDMVRSRECVRRLKHLVASRRCPAVRRKGDRGCGIVTSRESPRPDRPFASSRRP